MGNLKVTNCDLKIWARSPSEIPAARVHRTWCHHGAHGCEQCPCALRKSVATLDADTRRQIILQNGGAISSLQTSGFVLVFFQYSTSPSCSTTAGNPGSVRIPRRLGSHNRDGPGNSLVVAS